MDLTEQIAFISSILQEIGGDLYVQAFKIQGISALTIGQFRYLELIYKNPGITPGELARIFKVKKPTVTQSINELLRKKLITKRASEQDKRVSNLIPTKISDEIIQYRNSMYDLFAQKIKEVFTKDELKTYKELNTRIIQFFIKRKKHNGKRKA